MFTSLPRSEIFAEGTQTGTRRIGEVIGALFFGVMIDHCPPNRLRLVLDEDKSASQALLEVFVQLPQDPSLQIRGQGAACPTAANPARLSIRPAELLRDTAL